MTANFKPANLVNFCNNVNIRVDVEIMKQMLLIIKNMYKFSHIMFHREEFN